MTFQAILAFALILCIGLLGLLWLIRCSILSRAGRAASSSESTDSEAETEQESYSVKYVSERNSKSLLKPIPWDASGTLSSTNDGFHFQGSSPFGKEMKIEVNSAEAKVNYQRGNLFWDGGLTWCVIEVDGEKHYFTSDVANSTEEVNPEKRMGTLGLYRQLTNRYIREN